LAIARPFVAGPAQWSGLGALGLLAIYALGPIFVTVFVTSGKRKGIKDRLIVKYGALGPIATYLPERIETNDDLRRENPEWDMDLIEGKTGILQRHVAAPNECSSDLAVRAAENLFSEYDVDRASIDYLLFCTQTPDYSLPTTACLMQQRLGLRTDIGALDFNLGCSGFVYGLSLADGLIRTGCSKRVLLITAETYTKLIHPSDRSLRTIFGDGAAATLIEPHDQPSFTGFHFGTDGSGANTLMAACGGYRPAQDAIQPRHRKRWPSELYMDGPSLISFTVGKIPDVVQSILRTAHLNMSQIDLLIFHQATLKLLQQLRQVLNVSDERLPICLEFVGNTVGSTIPILIQHLRNDGSLLRDMKNVMIGFGVGWSWAGCVWQDRLGPNIR
jgi:3-oxoacyl-[acyl-carrier-protein] synthase-3